MSGNLVIDYGNSQVKAGLFVKDTLEEKIITQKESDLLSFTKKHIILNMLMSSVRDTSKDLIKEITVLEKKYLLTPALPLPIVNNYSTPETLGTDRIAAACGAQAIFPNDDSLVIDCGTCINYELIQKGNVYMGGGISPGLNMRAKAMNEFTSRLPLVKLEGHISLVGNSTETCIQSGVMNGVIAEVDGIISRYKDKYPNLRVLLTGGDMQFFEKRLKDTIFVAPDLVLQGLNRILLHNAGS